MFGLCPEYSAQQKMALNASDSQFTTPAVELLVWSKLEISVHVLLTLALCHSLAQLTAPDTWALPQTTESDTS